MKELIGFDGPDGSGKTSVAQELALVTGSQYIYFSDENILAPLRKQADELSYEERFAFYLSMNLLNHPRLEQLKLSSNRAIILDRTPLATFAFHEVMGINLKPFSSIKEHLLSQFDGLCYLHASTDARRARILARLGHDEMHKFDEFSLKFQDEIHKAFMSILPTETIVIDTSDLNITEVTLLTSQYLSINNAFQYE